MRMFFALFLVVLSLLLLPRATFAVYESTLCTKGATCDISEVGPLMDGISADCGNTGTCTLRDIEQVILNVGKVILKYIGSLVLLLYVIGGFMWIISPLPNTKKKGSDIIKYSTIGLAVILFAYVVVMALASILCVNDKVCKDILPQEEKGVGESILDFIW